MCKALRTLSNSQWVQSNVGHYLSSLLLLLLKQCYPHILKSYTQALYHLLYLKTSLQPIRFVSLFHTTTFPSAMTTVGNFVLTQSSDSVGVYQRDCNTTGSKRKQSILEKSQDQEGTGSRSSSDNGPTGLNSENLWREVSSYELKN